MNGIVKFSEAASIALHAMALLSASPERALTSHEMAERLPVSQNHLAKVLQRLAKAGLVDSIRGPRGGFLLRGEARQTTLLRVYEAVEGRLELASCLFPDAQNCTDCILGDTVQEANRLVRDRLARTPLSALASSSLLRADIVKLGRGRQPCRSIKSTDRDP